MFNLFKKKLDNESVDKYSTSEYIRRLSECTSDKEKSKVYTEEHKKWQEGWDNLWSRQTEWHWPIYPPPPVPPGYKSENTSWYEYFPKKPIPPTGYEE